MKVAHTLAGESARKGHRWLLGAGLAGSVALIVGTWPVLGLGSLTAVRSATVRPSKPRQAAPTPKTPIQHVVVIFQENHSFDNLLGGICVTDHLSCNGTTTGKLPDGTTITLAQASDMVPAVDHSVAGQVTAIDGGKMDGFANLAGCDAASGYACYSQFSGAQIPNLKALAESYVVEATTLVRPDCKFIS